MGRIPAHRAAGGYRMSLIRFVSFLALLFVLPVQAGNSTWTTGKTGATQYSSNSDACTAAYSAWLAADPSICAGGTGYCWTGAGPSATNTSCRAICSGANCTSGDQACSADVNKCPLTSLSAVCPAGETLSADKMTCSITPTSCVIAVGTVTRTGYFAIGTDPSGANFSGNPCLSSCTNTFFIDSLWSVLVGGVKNYYFKGYFHVTGAGPNGDFCSPDTANAPTPSAGVPAPTCPAGQSVGYVNGVPLCYTPTTPPPPGALPPVTTTTTTATVTNPDNSTTTTNTVNNPDSSQTITTTVTDPNGNKSTTVQQVPPPDQPTADQFCQNNPDAEVCKKKSECEKNPKAVGCAELGDTPTAEDILKRDIPISFNPVAIPENATCPAPIILNIGGHVFAIEYDAICQYAAGIRPVLLAVTYLTAALIMIGGIRENA